jgi:hypothetical protein
LSCAERWILTFRNETDIFLSKTCTSFPRYGHQFIKFDCVNIC